MVESPLNVRVTAISKKSDDAAGDLPIAMPGNRMFCGKECEVLSCYRKGKYGAEKISGSITAVRVFRVNVESCNGKRRQSVEFPAITDSHRR
jgi:hypothetical protein